MNECCLLFADIGYFCQTREIVARTGVTLMTGLSDGAMLTHKSNGSNGSPVVQNRVHDSVEVRLRTTDSCRRPRWMTWPACASYRVYHCNSGDERRRRGFPASNTARGWPAATLCHHHRTSTSTSKAIQLSSARVCSSSCKKTGRPSVTAGNYEHVDDPRFYVLSSRTSHVRYHVNFRFIFVFIFFLISFYNSLTRTCELVSN